MTIGLALLTGCGEGGEERAARQPEVGDPGPIHVHGLGINPKDGALFVATHTGLFRAEEGERRARRVADRFQDTMGFTVIGPDRFLGSGHPDGRENLPPFLGLIESRDAGRSWQPISLLGKRDFHVLEADRGRVYGFGSDYETRRAGLLVSLDGGRSWRKRRVPQALISLAIHPRDPDRVLASGERGLFHSRDGARSWRPVEGNAALVAWPRPNRSFAVDLAGTVWRSEDPAGGWSRVGLIGGKPAAFEGERDGQLLVALHDGTVKRSTDGGASWSVRSTP